MISGRVRAMRAPHWLALFGLMLGGWLVLFALAVPADLREVGRIYGSDFLRDLCTITPDAAGFVRLTGMWALMSVAMMAPTALPAFATYEDLGHRAPTQFGALVAGFLAVWFGFSILAAAAQIALFNADLLSAFGDSRSPALSAALLIGAGAYQFSPLKSDCLAKCRAPMTFFMAHWDEGPWRNGLRLGAACLGCCWALMALAFVGGMMSVAFMGLATLVMIIEKLPALGRYVTGPLGVALIVSGIAVGTGAI